MLLLAVLVAVAWPARWGGHLSLTVVHGGSMAPGYATGDLVVGWRAPVRQGDVVVYRAAGGLVVHRVVGGGPDGWVLRGDANGWDDPFHPASSDVLGTVVLHVPQVRPVGRVLGSPWVWLSVLAVGAGLLVWPGAGPPGPGGRGRGAVASVAGVAVLAAGTGACLTVAPVRDVASGSAPVLACASTGDVADVAGVAVDLVARDRRLLGGAVTITLPAACAGSRVRVLPLDAGGRPVAVELAEGTVDPGGRAVVEPTDPFDPASVRTWRVVVG